MALFPKEESYLGVDIGAGGMKLVELKKTKGRPQLWTYGVLDQALDIHIERTDKTVDDLAKESTSDVSISEKKEQAMHLDDPRIDTYAGYLRELVKRSRATSKYAIASIPVSYIFHTVVTLPEMEASKEMEEIILAEINKLMSRDVSEMQVVHQPIPQSPEEKQKKYIRHLVTAAPKEVVQFYSAIFQRAGLQLQELETEAFAIERSLIGNDLATTMIVDIGSERTNFFIMDQGLPITHRSIQIGGHTIDTILARLFGMDVSNVGQVKYDLSHVDATEFKTDAFRPVIDPIIKEVQHGFDVYLHQHANNKKHPEKIILTGGSAQFRPIAAALEKAFDMRVYVGDPWARTVYQESITPLLDANGARMSVAIGLALRNIVE